MNKKLKLLCALISYNMFDRAIDPEILATVDDTLLRQVYAFSKSHDIAHLAGDALVKHKLLPEGSPVAEKFQKSQLTAYYRYVLIDSQFHNICDLLEKEQIVFIPLKGSVIRNLYPEPYWRTSCDIDILISPDDCDRAISLLTERLNYRSEASTTRHDYQLYSPDGVHLELHHTLIEDNTMPKASEILNKVWDDAVPQSAFAYAMSNELFLFYHIVHMAKHFLNGGCGIRMFLDLLLVTDKFPADQAILGEMLEHASLTKFYDTALKLAKIWFYGEAHDQTTIETERYILSGGVYGSLKNSSAVKQAKGEKKIHYWIKVIFLPRENMELIYPSLKEHPERLLWYHVKRWFGFLNKKKWNQAKRVFKTQNSVLNDDVKTVGELMSNLDLNSL